ncbi:hypothetical protein D9613_009404 [Agrocybe pediades]|uniref:Uncharacterized protein n=1 Tax=Agrocybe pediades TaxID=84607 RepID=A0A8H4R2R3_9AGAR|nr:hypothetical protein D9613_009404 [Agrocybe pediades]
MPAKRGNLAPTQAINRTTTRVVKRRRTRAQAQTRDTRDSYISDSRPSGNDALFSPYLAYDADAELTAAVNAAAAQVMWVQFRIQKERECLQSLRDVMSSVFEESKVHSIEGFVRAKVKERARTVGDWAREVGDHDEMSGWEEGRSGSSSKRKRSPAPGNENISRRVKKRRTNPSSTPPDVSHTLTPMNLQNHDDSSSDSAYNLSSASSSESSSVSSDSCAPETIVSLTEYSSTPGPIHHQSYMIHPVDIPHLRGKPLRRSLAHIIPLANGEGAYVPDVRYLEELDHEGRGEMWKGFGTLEWDLKRVTRVKDFVFVTNQYCS